MTRLRHFDNWGTARFVTFSCYYRLPGLNQPSAKEIVIEELDRARDKHGFQILAYVLMPEHVHLVLYPPNDMELGLVIGEIKSRSAKRFFSSNVVSESVQQNVKRVFWHKRCYDHNCRTLETVWEKIHYCHNNPVKRCHVSDPSEWYWSSYNCYQGESNVPLIVDRLVL